MNNEELMKILASGEKIDLRNADLEGANLRNADLGEANLIKADLEGADLSGANLSRSKLIGANLKDANLERADLTEANLKWAVFDGANLSEAKLPDYMICPEEGDFIGYKKVKSFSNKFYIITLNIIGRRTSCLVGRKCRTDKAIVIDRGGASPRDTLVSIHDASFEYPEGILLHEPKYNPDIRVECTDGIHFFMTRKEAEEY